MKLLCHCDFVVLSPTPSCCLELLHLLPVNLVYVPKPQSYFLLLGSTSPPSCIIKERVLIKAVGDAVQTVKPFLASVGSETPKVFNSGAAKPW